MAARHPTHPPWSTSGAALGSLRRPRPDLRQRPELVGRRASVSPHIAAASRCALPELEDKQKNVENIFHENVDEILLFFQTNVGATLSKKNVGSTFFMNDGHVWMVLVVFNTSKLTHKKLTH
jgi:hypothetical protein